MKTLNFRKITCQTLPLTTSPSHTIIMHVNSTCLFYSCYGL